VVRQAVKASRFTDARHNSNCNSDLESKLSMCVLVVSGDSPITGKKIHRPREDILMVLSKLFVVRCFFVGLSVDGDRSTTLN